MLPPYISLAAVMVGSATKELPPSQKSHLRDSENTLFGRGNSLVARPPPSPRGDRWCNIYLQVVLHALKMSGTDVAQCMMGEDSVLAPTTLATSELNYPSWYWLRAGPGHFFMDHGTGNKCALTRRRYVTQNFYFSV